MLATSRSVILRHSSLHYKRFRHKVKQSEEKAGTKVAPDVLHYLSNTADYKDIVDKIPKYLLKKYKAPESMYLINKKTARNITETLISYISKDAPIVEINPGFGFLTKEILRHQKNNRIYLYEISNNFSQFLTDIKSQYPDRINLKSGDFLGMWKLAFKDKLDNGSRLKELLGNLATDDNDRILNIIGAMPTLTFVKHLIATIVFHNETSQLGRPDLYISIPGDHYEFLTDSSIQMSRYKSVPALFQLLFDFEILDKVPKIHFLPWILDQDNVKSVIDENCLYLVRITRKETLPCAPKDLPLLWYFFKPQTFSKHTRVIPMLEQWIPGCGVWLITGQDPPDTNKVVAPGKDDAALPHMTIFTEFGDLSLHQKLTVFKRFISWPEFEHCPYRDAMENNLPKFASQLNDDKVPMAADNLDEMESSDTEIEPEH